MRYFAISTKDDDTKSTNPAFCATPFDKVWESKEAGENAVLSYLGVISCSAFQFSLFNENTCFNQKPKPSTVMHTPRLSRTAPGDVGTVSLCSACSLATGKIKYTQVDTHSLDHPVL